jgi:hypothetical protein
MAPTTTIFAVGPQLLYFSTDLENKTCFGSTIIYFQNDENIQDGVFSDFFMLFFKVWCP